MGRGDGSCTFKWAGQVKTHRQDDFESRPENIYEVVWRKSILGRRPPVAKILRRGRAWRDSKEAILARAEVGHLRQL